MFRAPPAYGNSNEKAVVLPNGFASGGKINLNSLIRPFVDGAGKPLLSRSLPLESLLMGASADMDDPAKVVDATAAKTLAAKISSQALANSHGNKGKDFSGGSGFYFSPWQLSELEGISDLGEQGEALIREIGAVSSVRSNVFSIYTVGQTVRPLPTGGIQVLGERRSRIMVERKETLDASNKVVVKFRPVYSEEAP
jgi:hypothetical protein